MANLTGKELSALEDQLGFEKVMHCKFMTAEQECSDQDLKTTYRQYAEQHKKNYDRLLGYLN